MNFFSYMCCLSFNNCKTTAQVIRFLTKVPANSISQVFIKRKGCLNGTAFLFCFRITCKSAFPCQDLLRVISPLERFQRIFQSKKKVLIDRFNIEWKDLYNDGKIKNNFNK